MYLNRRLHSQGVHDLNETGADDTSPSAINPAGTTTGSYFAGKKILGFVRSRNGAVTTFLPPGATSVGPTAINAEGEVTGNYSDANSRVHGFLMKPRDE